MKRDANGDFSAGTITANLIGNVTGNANAFTGNLAGDVSGTQSATVVGKIQGRTVSSTAPLDNQILKYNSTLSQWIPADSSNGSVTSVNANAPLSVTNQTTTPVISLGVVPVANGGTGSSTQNFVDLSTKQTIAGNKTFSQNLTANTSVTTPIVSAPGGNFAIHVSGQPLARIFGNPNFPNVVLGAANNTVQPTDGTATISGGESNTAGNVATIGGGIGNSAGNLSTVGGGANNAAGFYNTIAGGTDNATTGQHTTIGGGFRNEAANGGVVSGGFFNSASGSASTVAGGQGNLASGDYSAALGGTGNAARAANSVALGTLAQVNSAHNGAMLLSDDSSNFPFVSAAPRELAARATGGVRFVTAVDNNGTPTKIFSINPSGNATVQGDLTVSGKIFGNLANPAWSLTGNSGTTQGTNFIGTTDNQALEVKVNSERAMRIEPGNNLIFGSSANQLVGPDRTGATIAGGGSPMSPNTVIGAYGTVGGGLGNQAGLHHLALPRAPHQKLTLLTRAQCSFRIPFSTLSTPPPPTNSPPAPPAACAS